MSSANSSDTRTTEFPYFSDETKLIGETVEKFCRSEIAPHAEKWDHEGIFPKDLFKKAGDIGLFGLRYPVELGGSGKDWWSTIAYIEALAHSGSQSVNMAFMVQSDMATPVILEVGTTEQKEQFLAPAIAGEKIAALGISEPGCGSDVAAVQCQARRSGDEYIINGQKLWITNGTRADFITLAVRTGEAGYKGISLITFPTDVKGFSVGRKLQKVGHLASDTAELFFDNCRIPARYLLGEEGAGFKYIMKYFMGERLVAAVISYALANKCIELALQYGRERKIFGKPISDYQIWQHKLAEHASSCEAGKWLCYRATDLINRGKPALKEITMAKLYNTDLLQKVSYDCMQMHGGFGYTTEYSIGRIWQDGRLYTIGGGASEVMKEIISKNFMS